MYADKKDSQSDDFPRRDNNTLKTLHQRIVNKNRNIPEQKMNTTVTGIPPYGMEGKRVGSEERRYVDEMASVPKSVYDPDKITIHVSSVSPYP